jgi:hypothetical protein
MAGSGYRNGLHDAVLLPLKMKEAALLRGKEAPLREKAGKVPLGDGEI